MTIDELTQLARVNEHVLLTIPRPRLPRGDQVRLAGRSGPLGRICTVHEEGAGYLVVACFRGQEILRWLGE